jgi:DNA-binding CsgD family transcriptional regulator
VSALYGRDPELRHFRATAQRVADGQTAFLAIEGEAGIGKSRLVDELVSIVEADNWPVVIFRSGELDVDQPFAPILDGLADFVGGQESKPGGLPSELVTAVSLLRASTKPDASSEQIEGGEQITNLIVEGIHEIARVSPLLIVFEDIHWVDEASARVLWRLARKRRNSRLFLASTQRPNSRPVLQALGRTFDTQGAATIQLGPLVRTDAEALASEILGESTTLDHALLNDAAGNPLFIIELMRGARETSRSGNDLTESGFPDSLRRLVIGRLRELPPETQAALFDAALLGQQLDLVEICAIRELTIDTIHQQLSPAIENRMLIEDGSHIGFQHAIVQSIVADSRGGLTRRARHGEIAHRLSIIGALPTRVAEHVWLSHPDATPEKLGPPLTWLRRAADAVIPLSLSSALSWNERALIVAVSDADRFDVTLEIAGLKILTGQLPAAEQVCSSLDGLPVSPDRVVRLRLTKASIATMRGTVQFDEASNHISWAIKSMQTNDPRRPELLGFKAVLSVFAGEIDRCREEANEALLCKVGKDKTATHSRAYEALAIADLLTGDIAAAQQHSLKATESFSYEHQLFTSMMMPHFTRALTLLATEPIRVVLGVLQDGYRICDRAGHALARLHLEPLTAIGHFLSGDLALSFRVVERTLEHNNDWDRGGTSLPTVTGLGAYLCMLQGDMHQASAMADRTIQELLMGGSQAGTSDFAVWCVAAVKESLGHPEEARDMLVFVWELIAKKAGLSTIIPDLVRMTVETQPEFAAEVVAISIARTQLSGSAMDRSNTLAARGHLEKNPTLLDEAAEVIESLGWRIQSAQLRTWATHMMDTKRPRCSEDDLHDRVHSLHKEWLAMEATSEAVKLEERYKRFFANSKVNGHGLESNQAHASSSEPEPGSETKLGLASLSQAERAVVLLVAEGLSNREIADRLYISHRTVESHVSHSLAKLKVTSRIMLASRVLSDTSRR